MLASPRGLSQLATSFIAYLRQGIHTHALSSLTIKSTLRFEFFSRPTSQKSLPFRQAVLINRTALPSHIFFVTAIATCSCPSITIQFSKNLVGVFGQLIKRCLILTVIQPNYRRQNSQNPTSDFCLPGNWWSWSGSNRRPPECKSGALPAELQPLFFVCLRLQPRLGWWAWVDSNYRPHPYQGCALTT